MNIYTHSSESESEYTQVIMSADPPLKHIQQRLLVTFLQFVQRDLGPSALLKLCIATYKCLALSLRSRWQILCEKQWTWRVSSSLGLTKPRNNWEYGSITDANGLHQVQVSGELNHQCRYASFRCNRLRLCSPSFPSTNIACSLFPSGKEVHNDSNPRPPQMLLAPTSPQSSESLSQDRNMPTTLHISMPDDSVQPIYTEQPYLVSPPIADTRHLATSHPSHRLRGYPQPYRSDSTESIEQPGSRETSGSITDMASMFPHLSIDLRDEDGPDGLFAVALEKFQRYERRPRV